MQLEEEVLSIPVKRLRMDLEIQRLSNATPCSRMANCRTYEMWKGLNDLISNYFGNITLADLARPDQAGNDYVI